MLLLKFVLKTNYLHIRNELKAYVYYLCFLKYWQISIFLSYQISSPSMQTHLRSHIGRGACLWEGWWNGNRFIKYLVTSLITRTSPMDIGYHVTYDNLVAKYCTIPLTVFRYLIWVWHGKIIIKIDFYQQKKIITILWLIVFHVRYTCLDDILVERNMLQWQDSFDSKLSM